MPRYTRDACCLATYASGATASRDTDRRPREERLRILANNNEMYKRRPFKNVYSREHDNGRSRTVHDFMVADDGRDVYVAFRGTAGVADLWVDTQARTNIAGSSRGFHEGFHTRAQRETPELLPGHLQLID